MLVKVILFLEVISIMLCIHQVYGHKIKIDILSIFNVILIVIWLDIVNRYDLNSIYTFVTHGLFLTYCLIRFKKGICETLVSMELSFALVSVVQFACIILWGFITSVSPDLRDFVTGLIVCLIVVFLFPYFKLDNLQRAICRRHWLMYIIIFFIMIIIICALVMLKMQGEVKIGFFIFGIPAMIIIFALVLFWDRTIIQQKNMELEINAIENMQDSYDDLLVKVRENQHGFNNHMMAIISSHHTYKTYEQLVEAQKEYVNILESENKYNNILDINNQILSGYLYVKFMEIEKYGISVIYKIETVLGELEISNYNLIEILGILLDNATEAIADRKDDKKIYFIIRKDESKYKFIIKNRYPIVTYEEMTSWFEKDVSSKGEKHGIGLYRVKKLCENFECTIICKNENYENDNWIVFELCIKEKEDVY